MNQRVLITVSVAGIGLKIAKAFAVKRNRVFGCYISNRDSIEKLVAFGTKALGGYEVVMNHAGIAGTTAPVEDIRSDDWKKYGRLT